MELYDKLKSKTFRYFSLNGLRVSYDIRVIEIYPVDCIIKIQRISNNKIIYLTCLIAGLSELKLLRINLRFHKFLKNTLETGIMDNSSNNNDTIGFWERHEELESINEKR